MMWQYTLISIILIFCLGLIATIEGNEYDRKNSQLTQIEGVIVVLAIDETDPATGQLKGKFIYYLQTEKGERFLLEPFSEVSFLPLRPNMKVKVIGIKRDKQILYKKILPIRE